MHITRTIDIRLSENTKNTIRWVVLPMVVLVGTVAIARATIDTSWITAGGKVSATSLSTDLTQLDARLTAVEGQTSALPAHGSVVWKDSTGAVVPIVRADGDAEEGASALGLEFIDSTTGTVWLYESTETDPIEPVNQPLLGYPTTNCTGTPYALTWNIPRYSLSVPTKPGYYVMPDNVAPTQIATLSLQNGSGTCQMGGLSTYAVPFSVLVATTKLTAPPGTPPYHPEAQ